jgi:hypothetical protein
MKDKDLAGKQNDNQGENAWESLKEKLHSLLVAIVV